MIIEYNVGYEPRPHGDERLVPLADVGGSSFRFPLCGNRLWEYGSHIVHLSLVKGSLLLLD